MGTIRNVAVVVGSLRKESFNRKMAKAMIALAPPSLKLEIVEIGQLPHYNQDFDADPPQEVKDFKGRIQQADAVLFVTPEYNRSMPGVLCANRWYFSTSRPCHSPRLTSEAPPKCSATPGRSSATTRASS